MVNPSSLMPMLQVMLKLQLYPLVDQQTTLVRDHLDLLKSQLMVDPTTDPSCQAPKGDQCWFAQSGWVVQKYATLNAWVVTKRVDETPWLALAVIRQIACAGQLSSSSDSSAPYLDIVRAGNEEPNHWIFRVKQFFNVPI
jgi:hypothetical protein